ncbi:MAG: hypothetical protein IKN63_03905 [Bacilli bacterium]|nr:hypothetical protein [Bacilli bacterium]
MSEIDNQTREIVERSFIDFYGMTIEEFCRLELDKQEELILKVSKLRNKIKNKESIKEKIKSIFKK